MCSLETILFLFFAINNLQSIAGFEAYLDQVEVKTPKCVEGVYNIPLLRIAKFNRSAFVLNSDFEFYTDIDDTYSVISFPHGNQLIE